MRYLTRLGRNVKQLISVGQVVRGNQRRTVAESAVAVEVCDGSFQVLLTRMAGRFAWDRAALESPPTRKSA